MKSKMNQADIFTKNLSRDLYEKHKKSIMTGMNDENDENDDENIILMSMNGKIDVTMEVLKLDLRYEWIIRKL